MRLPNLSEPGTKRGLAVAALLGVSAVALDQWPRRRPQPLERGQFPPELAMPASNSRLPPNDGGVSAEFDKLLELFREAESAPAAGPVVRKFVEEFKATPVLEQDFDEFEKDQKGPEPAGTLEGFVHALAERPEFRALVSRFAQDPGFRAVALQLSTRPEIREEIRSILARAQADRKALRAKLSISGRGSPRQGLGPKDLARGGPLASGDTQAGGFSGAKPTVTALPKTPGAHAGKEAAPSKERQAQQEAHDVNPRLAASGPVGKDDGHIQKFCRQPQYTGFCAGEPPSLKPEFKAIESMITQYGLWGACFRHKIYAKCVDACTGQCRPIEPWAACLDAFSKSEAACVGACQQQEPPCFVPEDVLGKYCRPKATGCDKVAKQAAMSLIGEGCGDKGEVIFPEPCACSPADCPPECGSTLTCSCTGTGCPPPVTMSQKPEGLKPSYWMGYNADSTGNLVIGPKQAETIRTMYELFIKYRGDADRVADKLNAIGSNTKNHKGQIIKDFTAAKVETLVQRCAYAGGWTERLRIIDDKTFDKAQKLIKRTGPSPLGCKGGGGPGGNRPQ